MSKLADWGFTKDSWKGAHGEYWVLAQGLILVSFAVLPSWHPAAWESWPLAVTYVRWVIALGCAGLAVILLS